MFSSRFQYESLRSVWLAVIAFGAAFTLGCNEAPVQVDQPDGLAASCVEGSSCESPNLPSAMGDSLTTDSTLSVSVAMHKPVPDSALVTAYVSDSNGPFDYTWLGRWCVRQSPDDVWCPNSFTEFASGQSASVEMNQNTAFVEVVAEVRESTNGAYFAGANNRGIPGPDFFGDGQGPASSPTIDSLLTEQKFFPYDEKEIVSGNDTGRDFLVASDGSGAIIE